MLLTVMVLVLFLLVIMGMDIAYAIGLAALSFVALTHLGDRPVNWVLFPQTMTAGVDSFALLAIPMFIFAGTLMTKCGVTTRLISFASALVGHKRGGLANVSITSNFFMSGISGSAIADAAAIGSILVPEMKRRGYPVPYACGVIAAGATMGPVIPPSILFILLGSIVYLSVGELFVAGVLPGFVMFLAMLATSWWLARRLDLPRESRIVGDMRRLVMIQGILPLGAPVLIICSKIFGIATPTESAALVVLFTLILGIGVYGTLTVRGFFEAASEAAMITAVVMLVVSTSQVFGALAVLAQLGVILTDAMLAISNNPYVLLLMINVILLLLGTVMDPLPVMLILAPILFPLMSSLGVDPIQLGIVMVLNLTLGMMTPPIGITLFVMARIGGTGVIEIFRYAWPYFIALLLVLMLITYVPFVTLALPELLMR